ncbi:MULTISPECIES: hypothetical protein [unclassified Actinobaculum]|uniref:hypothetical protein n=1 Tax=unclassified Actinobaculum TaxID=2609299 RepID=UPI000D529B86|nr:MULTISPECIES: hypothetical protein [unclassified Actinobaculum]AWE41499.1 hypothetical protein DDD63_00510 [Actinobaculum sp. 313]RTE48207.1 hypothetical protein EKN07_10745 [Actinobaculum sp. 352]
MTSDNSDSTFAPRGASDSYAPPSAEDVLSATYPQWLWGRARTGPQEVDGKEDLASIGDQPPAARQPVDAPQAHSASIDGMAPSSAAAPDGEKAAGADETTSSQTIDPLTQLAPGTHPRDLKVLIAAVIVLCIVLVMLAVDRNKETDSGSAASPLPSPTVSVPTTAIPARATPPISTVG